MSDHAKNMAAAGYLAGALTLAARENGAVLPVLDDQGNYTGEVQFAFLGDWYTATPRRVDPPPEAPS